MKLNLVKVNAGKGMSAAGYNTKYCQYGRVRQPNKPLKYRLQISIPILHIIIPLWYKTSKPWVRNLPVITCIWFPFAWIIFLVHVVLATIWVLLTDFYWFTLIKDENHISFPEKISGWISFVLSLVGAGYLISLLF